MRHEITAYRVFYGVPIMVTFAPNEKTSTLMIRLSRMRKSDPMAESCSEVKSWKRQWGELYEPDLVEHSHEKMLEGESIGISLDLLKDALPDCDVRRRIVARDPLACVYGFRMLVRVVLSTLFGVRTCSSCPDCNMHQGKDGTCMGCLDEFGSAALSEVSDWDPTWHSYN